MNIAEWQAKVYALAKEKGWWDGVMRADANVIPEKIALIHSEASEALEVYRDPRRMPLREPVYEDPDGEHHATQYPTTSTFGVGDHPAYDKPRKPVGFDSEMADIVIRVMDLCAHLGIDLERAIREKHAYNETRPRRHGGKRC